MLKVDEKGDGGGEAERKEERPTGCLRAGRKGLVDVVQGMGQAIHGRALMGAVMTAGEEQEEQKRSVGPARVQLRLR